MIRFGMYEYVRNIWFHLCIVFIMIIMMVITTVFLSNVDRQTRLYRLTEDYLDENSIFISFADAKLLEELKQVDKVLVAQTVSGYVEQNSEEKIISTAVYSEEVMKYIKPRLSSGVHLKKVDVDEDTVAVLISENPYGIGEGDTFVYNIYSGEEILSLKVYVAGIISEGQKIYDGKTEIKKSMVYEDFFTTYSYQQTGEVVMITTEQEMSKIGDIKKSSVYRNCIVTLEDGVTEESREENIEKISKFETGLFGFASVNVYPEAKDLVYRSKSMLKGELLKYIPLSVIVFVLLSICIMGMVTIKTARSTRYYGILYACGMEYRVAQLMTGLEMGMNCLIAVIFTVSLLKIQNNLKLMGEINCSLELPELMAMVLICAVLILWSVFTARGILKENTPVEILKDRE